MAKNDNKHSKLVKTVIILGLFLFGLIIFAIYKENYKKNQAEEAIEKMRMEAEKIERNNLDAAEKLAYLESRDYQEREARDKLNMQNPNENIVIVEPGISPPGETQSPTDENGKKLFVKTTNIQRWWNYFFKY